MALELNQRTWLYIYPLNVNSSYKTKLFSIVLTGCTLTFMLLSIVSSVLYILTNASVDFTGVLYASFQLFGSLGTVYMTITAYFLRPEIVELIQKFRHIHRASESFVYIDNFVILNVLMCV